MAANQIYLEDIQLEQALARLLEALEQAGALAPLPGEAVPVADACGRVTAEPVWARLCSPHYHAAAMDGYAVAATCTTGATETAPLLLDVDQLARYVDTGQPMPAGTDAVIPIELAQRVQGEGGPQVEILAPVAPWQHVRSMGEDMVATELVLPENHVLGPADLGAAAGCGHGELLVRRRPRVAIQPTGTELVAPGAAVKAGSIVEYNSIVLAAMAQQAGAEVTRLPPQPDEPDAIREAVAAALKTHDLVLINAGASAGSHDYTARVMEQLGQVLVHGVAIRPGHPVVLGLAQDKPLLGIPGYPVSAAITFELFGLPLIHAMQGLPTPRRPELTATLTRKVVSSLGLEEFLRVSLGRVGQRLVATPVRRGAGVITSLVRADGVVRIPRFSEGVHAGAEVQVESLRPLHGVERTIVVIGSHDMTLDLLASHMARQRAGLRLTAANVGSLGGLLALGRGECHMAGSHLLDEQSGEYNVSYIRQHLARVPVVLLGFVGRQQGLMVAPGNPQGITRVEDLSRDGVTFVNRQRGAGTRVLLDYELKQRGIDPGDISGYQRQEFTHLAVAAAVSSGVAHCGLGILAAARALKLDFIPLLEERYDLVIPAEHFDGELLAPLLATLQSADFRRDVEALGGYTTRQMGQVLARVP